MQISLDADLCAYSLPWLSCKNHLPKFALPLKMIFFFSLFSIPWKKDGVDTEVEEHETYMSEFCEVLSARLHELISRHIKQDPEVKARNKNIQVIRKKIEEIKKKKLLTHSTSRFNWQPDVQIFLKSRCQNLSVLIIHGTIIQNQCCYDI